MKAYQNIWEQTEFWGKSIALKIYNQEKGLK